MTALLYKKFKSREQKKHSNISKIMVTACLEPFNVLKKN